MNECVTKNHQSLPPRLAIGCDRRNQTGVYECQPPIVNTVSDGGATVMVRFATPYVSARPKTTASGGVI